MILTGRARVREGEDVTELEQVRAERDAARAELAIVEADAKAAFAAVVPGWDSPDALLAAHDRMAAFIERIREARAHGCDTFCVEGGCDFDLAGFIDQVDDAFSQLASGEA